MPGFYKRRISRFQISRGWRLCLLCSVSSSYHVASCFSKLQHTLQNTGPLITIITAVMIQSCSIIHFFDVYLLFVVKCLLCSRSTHFTQGAFIANQMCKPHLQNRMPFLETHGTRAREGNFILRRRSFPFRKRSMPFLTVTTWCRQSYSGSGASII